MANANEGYFEVDFHRYCNTCVNKDVDESKEPCDACMEENIRYETNIPINYKEKSK